MAPSDSKRRRPKVLVIAVAEASLELIERWVARGKLPAFARLMSEGSFGTLHARFPLSTVERWAGLMTGVDAGRHGIYDVFQRRPNGRFHEISRADVAAPQIWERLSDAGLRCAVLNVPLAFPPPSIHGYVVAGYDAPGAHRSMASPPAVYDDIVDRFGAYPFYENFFRLDRRRSEYPERFERGIPPQADALEHLIGAGDWDFFLTWHSAIAQAQHYFWTDMEGQTGDDRYAGLIEHVYELFDPLLERALAAAGPETTVFVLSDCGAGPLRYGVDVNRWLAGGGLAAYESATAASTRSTVQRLWRHIPFRRMRPDLLPWYLLPEAPARRLAACMRMVRERMQTAVYAELDWSRTRAYARGIQGTVFVNLAGREPHGIIAPGAEYESVRDEVIARLDELRDPDTGKEVVRCTYRAEEVYGGRVLPHTPDLFIEWNGLAYLPTETPAEDGSLFVPRRRGDVDFDSTADHRPDGVVFAMGPGIERGRRIAPVSPFDLAPTWLEAFGVTAPADMMGSPVAAFGGDGRRAQL
jgi:predicted AlkP superfamily phosphohydrolase/phosphomutase